MIPEEVNGYKITFDNEFVIFNNGTRWIKGSKHYVEQLIFAKRAEEDYIYKEIKTGLTNQLLENIYEKLNNYELKNQNNEKQRNKNNFSISSCFTFVSNILRRIYSRSSSTRHS